MGVATVDADDIVHALVPAEERRRLAKVVFADPEARRELESRIHPLVAAELERHPEAVHVIPLLFECNWQAKYDIICCVTSERGNQIRRMMTTRGYTREEAESRLAAQMPVDEKAAKSHCVIRNDGTAEELRAQVAKLVERLKEKRNG